MRNRHVFILLLAAGLILGGCSRSSGVTNTPSEEALDSPSSQNGEPPLTFGIIYPMVNDTYEMITENAEAVAKKNNVELLVQAPDEANLEQQVRIMEMMIKRGVDGIAIAPADSLALTSVINKAVSRGFPLFVLSRIRLPAAEKPLSGLIIEQPALLLDRLWNACLAEKG